MTKQVHPLVQLLQHLTKSNGEPIMIPLTSPSSSPPQSPPASRTT